ncbi:DUF6801 domain-containing protein [Streptomyces sp. NPDC048182]|uniref:DUF6801 domain-containing protein n=1 Tax=Streptomyces sp. NPDC048182 TaxID=3365507 RepID=UPI00371A343B
MVLAAGLPAAAVAAGAQEVDAALPYTCSLPSGRQPVTVRVTARFPDRVAAGEPIRPTDVTTAVELPEAAVRDLAARGASVERAETRLGVRVAQNDNTAEATWRGSVPPAALPPSGPLTLTATGDVPTVTGQSAGDLTLSAGALSLDLSLAATAETPSAAATGTPSEAATATGPSTLGVECALAEDAPGDGLLATVPVGPAPGDGSSSPSPSDTPSASATGTDPGTPDEPGEDPAGRPDEKGPTVADPAPGGPAPAREAPPCKYGPDYPMRPMSLNAYITGYNNVNKLKGAQLFPVSCTFIEQGDVLFTPKPDFSGGYLTQHSTGDLFNQGRKQSRPVEGTFLTFGFTPTKARIVLEETGQLTVDSVGETDFVFTSTDTYIRVPLVVHMLSLEVNGTPLDVGPDCRTERPLYSPEPEPAKHPGDHLVLFGRGEQVSGQVATGYQLLSGGPLTGTFTIPAFTGCGTGGEDLDRLLTASISGPDNYIKQIQGQTCFAAADVLNPLECTPDGQPLKVPVPER